MRMISPVAVGLAALMCGCPVITEDMVNQKNAAYGPYANGGGWTVDHDCIDNIDNVNATGNQPGDIAEDFALEDQYGDTVLLHHFCNRVVLIMAVSDWDGGSPTRSAEVQALYEEYGERGFLPLALLGSGEPSVWSEELGLTYPVLFDLGFNLFYSRFVDQIGSFSIPNFVLLKPGLEILWRNGYELAADDIEPYLPL